MSGKTGDSIVTGKNFFVLLQNFFTNLNEVLSQEAQKTRNIGSRDTILPCFRVFRGYKVKCKYLS